MSTGTVLDDDDRFAGLERLSLTAPDGTTFTLHDISTTCKSLTKPNDESMPHGRHDMMHLLAPPGCSAEPGARINPAMLANQVCTMHARQQAIACADWIEAQRPSQLVANLPPQEPCMHMQPSMSTVRSDLLTYQQAVCCAVFFCCCRGYEP
jgi:hypothetical protein